MEKEGRVGSGSSLSVQKSDGARMESCFFLTASCWAGQFIFLGLSLLICQTVIGTPLLSQKCAAIKETLSIKEMNLFAPIHCMTLIEWLHLPGPLYKTRIDVHFPRKLLWGLQEITHTGCLAESLVLSKDLIDYCRYYFYKAFEFKSCGGHTATKPAG